MLRSLLWAVAAAGLGLLGAGQCGAGPLEFRLTNPAGLAKLSIGEFAPGTLQRGGIETQASADKIAVTGARLTIDTGTESDCGLPEADAEVLTKPNATASSSFGQCLFAARLTLMTAQGPTDIEGECDDWRQDVSYCWVAGDLGQFWLRRQPAAAGQTLDLILGPYDWAVAPIATVGEPPPAPIPQRGIMLDSVFDDAGRAVTDRWLLMPAEVVTLPLAR